MKKYRLFLAAALILLAALLAKPVRNFWLDATFYSREHTAAELQVKAYAEEKGISIGAYPRSLVALLERNPETAEFVLNYPFRSRERGTLTREELADGVPLLLQWDGRWGYEKYGSDFLAVTGCGPTCLSMVYTYLTGDLSMTPAAMARFARQEGYYERGYGSSWTLISKGGPELGLQVTELPLVKKRIVTALEEGCPVILALGAGDFTAEGHYIVLTGMEEGLFRVNDPNSILRSQKLWSYEELEHQIRNIWRIELPQA